MAFDAQRPVASPSGALLNLYVRLAPGSPRAIVHINHGLAEHAARYERFADFLAENGVTTYAHDHRGHGLTTAPDAPAGRFGTPRGGEKVIADVAAVHDLIRQENPGVPIILFGHSMGGMIALNYVSRHSAEIGAAAIWNATLPARLSCRAAQAVLAWEKFRLGSDVPSRLLPVLTFRAWAKEIEGHMTPFDWLSRDADEVRQYIEDPLCGWDPSISLWRDLFGFALFAGDDRNFSSVRRDLPINLVGGEKDPATGGGQAVRHLAKRFRRMGFSNLVSTIYDQTRHESLNEINREAIVADFMQWLDAALRR